MFTVSLYLLLVLIYLNFTVAPSVERIYCKPISHPAPPLTLSSCKDAVKFTPVNSIPTANPNVVGLVPITLVRGKCTLSIDLGIKETFFLRLTSAKFFYRDQRRIAQRIVTKCSGHGAGTAVTTPWLEVSGIHYDYTVTVRVT